MWRYEVRPLGAWDRSITEYRATSRTFRAEWEDTVDMLGMEASLLNDGAPMIVVIQADAAPDQIRRDGMIRASARINFPGVKVSFPSRHGPLTYATDVYDSWKANVRAIALGLKALRAVDRYGITQSGEQYRGFTPLAATSWESGLTIEDAVLVFADATGQRKDFVEGFARVLHDSRSPVAFVDDESVAEAKRAIKHLYNMAAKRNHPDAGGSVQVMALINKARDVLIEGPR